MWTEDFSVCCGDGPMTSPTAAASLAATVAGSCVHGLALVATYTMRPRQTRLPAGTTSCVGQVLWITWQCNVLCLAYFSCGVASTQLNSRSLDAIVAGAYPFTFAIGALTPSFYMLQFLPAKLEAWRDVRRRVLPLHEACFRACWSRNDLADHCEHLLSTPAAACHAATLRLAARPTNAEIVLPILGFVAWSFWLLVGHRVATGQWAYPIMAELHQRYGPMGILFLTCERALVLLGLGYLASALVQAPHHGDG
jgi:hypothetical protein